MLPDMHNWAHVENTEEEAAEVVKHLGEEVPPHADIRSEIRNGEAGRT